MSSPIEVIENNFLDNYNVQDSIPKEDLIDTDDMDFFYYENFNIPKRQIMIDTKEPENNKESCYDTFNCCNI